MYLFLLREVFQSFYIPKEVSNYTVIHFNLPFVKAKRQAKRINLLCELMPFYNTILCEAGSEAYKPVLKEMFKDPLMELDLRIVDDRIEKYVMLIGYLQPLDQGFSFEDIRGLLEQVV